MVDKNIVIFSPQNWSHLKVSKHHYATQLALSNNVLFICVNKNFKSIKTTQIQKNLLVVEISICLQNILIFKCPKIYKLLWINSVINYLKTKMPIVDVVFDFGCYQFFDNLNFIKATKKIYFPVDDNVSINSDVRGADYVFSVSKNIVEKLEKKNNQVHLINHGLSRVFLNTNNFDNNKETDDKLNVCYSGNLFIKFLNRNLLSLIINNNPDINFNFFGSNNFNKNNLNDLTWYNYLISKKNVYLKGQVEVEKLALEFKKQDAFLLIYEADNENYHCENSHKILEYLSSGKVIVTTPISYYENFNLFEVCKSNDHQIFSNFFSKVISNIGFYNSDEKAKLRQQYAFENSYEKQIERISKIVYS